MFKKIIIATALSVASFATITTLPQSCTAVSSSPIGVSVIKSSLLSGIRNTEKEYATPQDFLKDDRVLTFLPKQLRTLYDGIQRFSPETGMQIKNYLAGLGVETVQLASPILKNSVNQLTGQDVRRIMEGAPGTATLVLKEKAELDLYNALLPKVDSQLKNLGGNFGQNALLTQLNPDISTEVTHQIIDGIFLALKKYEVENHSTLIPKN